MVEYNKDRRKEKFILEQRKVDWGNANKYAPDQIIVGGVETPGGGGEGGNWVWGADKLEDTCFPLHSNRVISAAQS